MTEKAHKQIPEYRVRAHQKGENKKPEGDCHKKPQCDITSLAILFSLLNPFLPPDSAVTERASHTGDRFQQTLTDGKQVFGKIPLTVIYILVKHQAQGKEKNSCFGYELYAYIVCEKHGYAQQYHAHNGKDTVFF